MPASMISAPVGSTLNVSGNNIAIVAIGPMPGSTPIKVPTRQPMKASRRFAGDNAVAKPSPRLPTKSNIDRASIADQPRRERDRKPERKLEQADAKSGHEHAHHDRFPPANLVAGKPSNDDRNGPRHNQPQRAHGQPECRNGESHKHGPANRPSLERKARFHKRIQDQKRAE